MSKNITAPVPRPLLRVQIILAELALKTAPARAYIAAQSVSTLSPIVLAPIAPPELAGFIEGQELEAPEEIEFAPDDTGTTPANEEDALAGADTVAAYNDRKQLAQNIAADKRDRSEWNYWINHWRHCESEARRHGYKCDYSREIADAEAKLREIEERLYTVAETTQDAPALELVA